MKKMFECLPAGKVIIFKIGDKLTVAAQEGVFFCGMYCHHALEKNRNHEMLLELWVNAEPMLRIASAKGNRYPNLEVTEIAHLTKCNYWG